MPTYKIRTGDTPEKISAKFGITVPDLYKKNQGTYQYKTGVTIKVPGTGRRPVTFGRKKGEEEEPAVPVTRPSTYVDPIAASRSKQIPFYTNKPAVTAGGGVVYPTAEEIYISSGANTREIDWSKTMGANLGPITADDWRRGVRPERITSKNAKEIGVEDNWMRENGYVLIGDTWCLSAQTSTWQEMHGNPTPTPTPTAGTTTTGGPYTENVQWRVSTG